jgi:hypothetical protein
MSSHSPLQKSYTPEPEVCRPAVRQAQSSPAFQFTVEHASCGREWLGFPTGTKKGFDPDDPRHLSRVVILD